MTGHGFCNRVADLVEDLDSVFNKLHEDLGEVEAVLGFDCILRYIEMEQGQMLSPVSNLLRANKVVGFNTYGEQHGGLHVNQTFVGLALLEPEAPRAAVD